MTYPGTIDGHLVLAYAWVDAQTEGTGRVVHIVGGKHLEEVRGLAICWVERESRAALMRCTDDWSVLTDTWHATAEEAKRQASQEFEGLEWIDHVT